MPGLVQGVLARFPVPDSITTVLELPADLPEVFVDPRQMEQVLGNLMVNACQAMKDGGELTISGVRYQQAGSSGSDPASGIPAQASLLKT